MRSSAYVRDNNNPILKGIEVKINEEDQAIIL